MWIQHGVRQGVSLNNDSGLGTREHCGQLCRLYGADMSNLALNLVATARRIPQRVAAIAEEHAMSYSELDAASS